MDVDLDDLLIGVNVLVVGIVNGIIVDINGAYVLVVSDIVR